MGSGSSVAGGGERPSVPRRSNVAENVTEATYSGVTVAGVSFCQDLGVLSHEVSLTSGCLLMISRGRIVEWIGHLAGVWKVAAWRDLVLLPFSLRASRPGASPARTAAA